MFLIWLKKFYRKIKMRRRKNKKDKRKIIFSDTPKTKRLKHSIIKFVSNVIGINIPIVTPLEYFETPNIVINYL